MQNHGKATTPFDPWQAGADLADASRVLYQDGRPEDAARFHELILAALSGTADPATTREIRDGYAWGAQAQLADLREFDTMRRQLGRQDGPAGPIDPGL